MKVDYISDLHLDFWIKEIQQCEKQQKKIAGYTDMIQARGGNVIIIAGDLGHYFSQNSAFLLYLKTLYKYVIFVPGNHDMYLVSHAQQKKYMYQSNNRILEMKRFCRLNDIIFLDGNTVVIEGIKFAGLQMSWDRSFLENLRGRVVQDAELLNLYNNIMNDPRLIFNGSDHIVVQDIYGSYKIRSFDPLKFFNEEYEKLNNIEDADVMVSHYGPTYDPNIKTKYLEDSGTTFFYFDGRSEIERINPNVWIYGHTHDKADYMFQKTRMLCNPLGYPGENTYNIVRSFDIV